MNILNKFTLKTLFQNRTRTIVTIIGIILSASMFSAVTTSIASMQDYMIQRVIEENGNWHGTVFDMTGEELAALDENSDIDSYVTLQQLGYTYLEEGVNEYKPYLFLAGADESFLEKMPVNITEGRFPENSAEILIPVHLKQNGGVSYEIGETLELSMGLRFLEDTALTQQIPFDKHESLELTGETRIVTVVGFYERPDFEYYSAPGYTALTVPDENASAPCDAYILLKDYADAYTYFEVEFSENGKDIEMNYSLLGYSGSFITDETMFTVVTFGAILIAIIMFGSISLIYNAFSISISERTKQFGLLTSIGATRRQILRSVLFEAFVLGIIGIPLGILAGIGGIGVTLKLTQNMFLRFIGGSTAFSLSISWPAILTAAVVGFVTILISAYLPARRAVKMSAIDAIRQTTDIKINPKKVKTARLTYRLFGFEGMLASKNFKRNRKKYRATVISLFSSIVLFVSVSGLTGYLGRSADTTFDITQYDISYTLRTDEYSAADISLEETLNNLDEISEISRSAYVYEELIYFSVPKSSLNREYMDSWEDFMDSADTFSEDENGNVFMEGYVYFIDDTEYERFLRENKFDVDTFMDSENPVALVRDSVTIYTDEGYRDFNILQEDSFACIQHQYTVFDDCMLMYAYQDENGDRVYNYENNEDITRQKTSEEVETQIGREVGGITDKSPFFLGNYQYSIVYMYPQSAMEAVRGTDQLEFGRQIFFYFQTADHRAAFDKIVERLDELEMPSYNVWDKADDDESARALITVINIFCYGFTILISLIAMVNVFNTIFTNVRLRRREIAMLQSAGMTRKSFRHMMNYECIFYGLKGLSYGLPVSILVNLLMCALLRVSSDDVTLYMPWTSMLLSVIGVFSVVFATMLYATMQIRKESPVEALKNENL